MLTLTPQVKDISVMARGNQLCIEGLSFGQTHHLTFKADFPRQTVKTEEPISLALHIPHRRPFIRFRERGFILPQHGPQKLPFMAVNVPEVKINIIYVPERNIHYMKNGFRMDFLDGRSINYQDGKVKSRKSSFKLKILQSAQCEANYSQIKPTLLFPVSGTVIESIKTSCAFKSLPFIVSGGKPYVWMIDQAPVATQYWADTFFWTPHSAGYYIVTVMDAMGQTAESHIEVRGKT